MAQSPYNQNRLFDANVQMAGGVNSDLHPCFLSPTTYAWSVNTVNKGAIVATRPGQDPLFRLPDGKAQGMTIFTPTDGEPTIVTAVNGKIYISVFPFTDFEQLPNIQFHPLVDHVVFKEALQSVQNGVVVDPKAVLIMQDGRTRPAYWDGSVNRHLSPGGASRETVLGLWMEWVGARLWVARGREIFASDIFDPLHFIETGYLAQGGSLQPIDGDIVTGLSRTADNKALLAMTIHNTTIIRALLHVS